MWMTHRLVQQSVEVVWLHLLKLVRQAVEDCIRVRYVIEHLPAIVFNSMKMRVKELISNEKYSIRQNSEYKEQKQQHTFAKVAKLDLSRVNLK